MATTNVVNLTEYRQRKRKENADYLFQQLVQDGEVVDLDAVMEDKVIATLANPALAEFVRQMRAEKLQLKDIAFEFSDFASEEEKIVNPASYDFRYCFISNDTDNVLVAEAFGIGDTRIETEGHLRPFLLSDTLSQMGYNSDMTVCGGMLSFSMLMTTALHLARQEPILIDLSHDKQVATILFRNYQTTFVRIFAMPKDDFLKQSVG